MPLHIPITVDVAEKVWAYATRKLTSLNDPTDLIKYIADGTGSLIPADTSLYDHLSIILTRLSAAKSAYLDYLPIYEFEKSFACSEAFADISVTDADQSLGSKTINVVLPSGASIMAAIAIAIIHILNDAAVAQKIDLKLNVAGTNVFDESDVVGLPALEAASAAFSIIVDVSAVITTTGNKVLEAFTTLSDAHSTHFTTEYGLIIIYRMG